VNKTATSVTVAVLLSAICFSTSAAANQVALNGFLIYQFRDTVKKALGKPFQTGESKRSEYEAYTIGNDAYMAFEYLKDHKDWVYSIQISGTTAKMRPFKGLVLGDKREKIIRALGKPDRTEKVKDGKKELLVYDSENCSVELDSAGTLVSIRIYWYQDLFNPPDADNEKNWEAFRRAMLKKDFKDISKYFRPDAEIYRGGKVLSIDKPFEAFFLEGKGEFFDALFSNKNSVYSEVKSGRDEMDLRLHEKMGSGFVHKFRKSKVLEEIYFLPYAGNWRIYEVKFRD
jgi:hypothetical protein